MKRLVLLFLIVCGLCFGSTNVSFSYFNVEKYTVYLSISNAKILCSEIQKWYDGKEKYLNNAVQCQIEFPYLDDRFLSRDLDMATYEAEGKFYMEPGWIFYDRIIDRWTNPLILEKKDFKEFIKNLKKQIGENQ